VLKVCQEACLVIFAVQKIGVLANWRIIGLQNHLIRQSVNPQSANP